METRKEKKTIALKKKNDSFEEKNDSYVHIWKNIFQFSKSG